MTQTAKQYSQSLTTILKKNEHLELLPEIIKELQAQAEKERLITKVEVISAAGLRRESLKSLQIKLKKKLGYSFELVTKIDPDILGGIIIKIGDKMYDQSFRTRLDDIKTQLWHFCQS